MHEEEKLAQVPDRHIEDAVLKTENRSDCDERAISLRHGTHSEEEDIENVVTAKTWLVVAALAFSYGTSFWPVPFFSTIQFEVASSFGSPAAVGTWITSVYIAAATIAFMICGANSDLFGRRYFILMGNLLVFIGSIVGGTSQHIGQSIVAHTLIGFGAGNCQLATYALPELLPNKWRHWAVVIADGVAFFTVIAGPVTARVAIANGEAWRWGYWSTAISITGSFAVLACFYYPPRHPRGVPWGEAVRNLDYVGIVAFILSAAMILSGIVYVQLVPSDDPRVVGLLVAGFISLLFFALWETFAPLKEPLTPKRLFTNNNGRTLTAPFIVGFVVTMFYFGTNIIWGEMVSILFTNENTSKNTIYWLATVQGFGILVGGLVLSFGGTYFQHWRWQMGLSITFMTFFGGLLAYITPGREGLGVTFAFLSAAGFGYAQYLSITYIQFGAEQKDLGIAGGLAGVARESGGAIAVTTFQTILVHVQSQFANQHVIAAAESAGASPQLASEVLAALVKGSAALEHVQGLTPTIASAAGAAFIESYVQGLKTVALTLTGFGGVAMIACCFLEDIGPKMTKKIEVFLENDVLSRQNEFH